jgi:hypothetical protein
MAGTVTFFWRDSSIIETQVHKKPSQNQGLIKKRHHRIAVYRLAKPGKKPQGAKNPKVQKTPRCKKNPKVQKKPQGAKKTPRCKKNPKVP